MNADHFESMSPEMKAEFEKMYEPVEKSGKQLKREIGDEDRMIMFERRKEALKPQTKK